MEPHCSHCILHCTQSIYLIYYISFILHCQTDFYLYLTSYYIIDMIISIDTIGMYGGEYYMARNKYPEETVNLILEQSLKLFVEKGYDNTSIQDIINNLGGLSKGAIYHHFKSKEEIFEGVCNKIAKENCVYYDKIRDDPSKNGYEKLKIVFQSAYSNPNSRVLMAMTTKIMRDPKFLMNQISEMYDLVAPNYIKPIIEQGIKDGSIKTDYPKELAEVIITLINVWINPSIAKTKPAEMEKKLEFFHKILLGLGIDVLDQEIINQYIVYCEDYYSAKI